MTTTRRKDKSQCICRVFHLFLTAKILMLLTPWAHCKFWIYCNVWSSLFCSPVPPSHDCNTATTCNDADRCWRARSLRRGTRRRLGAYKGTNCALLPNNPLVMSIAKPFLKIHDLSQDTVVTDTLLRGPKAAVQKTETVIHRYCSNKLTRHTATFGLFLNGTLSRSSGCWDLGVNAGDALGGSSRRRLCDNVLRYLIAILNRNTLVPSAARSTERGR
jgi:hypothetical protein